jgi:hypothetical protein
MVFEALLSSGNDASPQHWGVLRAIHTLNPSQNYMVFTHPFYALAQSARPHVGCWGAVSAGGGHGWLWL